jgi:hypothetical protein
MATEPKAATNNIFLKNYMIMKPTIAEEHMEFCTNKLTESKRPTSFNLKILILKWIFGSFCFVFGSFVAAS